MLLINGVPIECINKAAIAYYVPAPLIISVLKIENGKVGQARPDSNGTYDYGPMQINTIWLKQIKKYGYTQHEIQYNPCINVAVGAWILGKQIANSDSIWRGIGDYHSHTTKFNLRYRKKVHGYYHFLEDYLHGKTNKREP